LSIIETCVYWPAREHHIHALALLEVPRQLRPDRFGDELLAMQIVGRPQQRRIGLAPAGRVGADLDSSDLVIGQAGTPGDRHVLGPLIAGAAEKPVRRMTISRSRGGSVLLRLRT